MVRLRNFCGSVRWSRHRKDGVPKKRCGSVRWSRHRNDGLPKKLCGSARWSRHRKDGVPKELCGSARWSRHRKDLPSHPHQLSIITGFPGNVFTTYCHLDQLVRIRPSCCMGNNYMYIYIYVDIYILIYRICCMANITYNTM